MALLTKVTNCEKWLQKGVEFIENVYLRNFNFISEIQNFIEHLYPSASISMLIFKTSMLKYILLSPNWSSAELIAPDKREYQVNVFLFLY